MRVLVCGDRNWSDFAFMARALAKWENEKGPITVLIEGCARGADSMAGHRWAPGALGDRIYVEHYPALWDKHGKAAGPIRNQQMLDEGKPEFVIAFHADIESSRGTRDMVRRARRAGIPVWLPYPQPQQTLNLDSGPATDF